jgi:pyruvate dehydrogenase E2 component (dihydrolipoamide acetyltransferase)
MSHFRAAERLPTWRKLALGTWGAPSNPTAYGVLDLNCELAMAWLERSRESSGEKVSLTHLVGKAAALAIASVPEVNGFASFGGLRLRDTVDVFFQVAYFDDGAEAPPPSDLVARRDANLSGAKVVAADGKSVVQIARELRERSRAIRSAGDDVTVRATKTMARLPGPLRSLGARAGAFASFDLGLDLDRFGIPSDPFGSCMVSSVAAFGIEVAWAPLIPYARTPIVITLGAVHSAPTVVGSEVVARRRVSIGVAFDHRVMDGYHAGVLSRRFRRIFSDPEAALGGH